MSCPHGYEHCPQGCFGDYERLVEARTIISDLLAVQESLMPGLAHIAVQDYQILNDAPIAARRWLIVED